MTTKRNPDFGMRLRQLRIASGWSQTDLIRQLRHQEIKKYNKSDISKWETGTSVPPCEVVNILEDIFPVDPGSLLKLARYVAEAENKIRGRGGEENHETLDPVFVKARTKHLDRIEQQLRSLQSIVEDTFAVGCYGEIGAIPHCLFPRMLQHCPSVNKKYQLLISKNKQIELSKTALAAEIKQKAPPGATKQFSEMVPFLSLRLAMGKSPSHYSLDVSAGEYELIVFDKTIARGDLKAIKRFRELHKDLVREYANNQNVMLDYIDELRRLHWDLEETVRDSLERCEWDSGHDCDQCPGRQQQVATLS